MPEKIHLDYEDVKFLIEGLGLQQWKVAQMMSVHTSTIEKFCKKMNLKTQKTGPRRGELHPDWKGGKVWIGGYLYVYCPDHPYCTKARRVAYHRLVMEEKLGRYLDPKEVVHHIDGNPRNNHPDNLVVFQTNADHLMHELAGRVPNWTRQGFENMCKAHPEWKKSRFASKYGVLAPVHTTDHQTS